MRSSFFSWIPKNFEPVGKPVRYTFNSHDVYPGISKQLGHAMDRWPDIWVYNAKFQSPNSPDTTGKAGHLEVARPLEGIRSALATTLKKTAAEKGLKGTKRFNYIFGNLQEYAADRRTDNETRDRSREAKDILKQLDAWVKGALEKAKKQETGIPGDAYYRYKNIQALFKRHPSGKEAEARSLKLLQNPKQKREIKAWKIYRKIRRAAVDFELPPGAEPSCEDEDFYKANKRRVSSIHKNFVTLQGRYQATRAMLEARSLVLRYAIKVPVLRAKHSRVLAEVTGKIIRVSVPKTVNDVWPYTETFICTEYKISTIHSGRVKGKTVFAIEMAMQNEKDLPPASYKVGENYTLKLGSWEEQKHLHTLPTADGFIEGADLDEIRYFVFSSKKVK